MTVNVNSLGVNGKLRFQGNKYMVLSNNRFKMRAFFDRSCPCLLMEDGKVLAKWSWTNSHVN